MSWAFDQAVELREARATIDTQAKRIAELEADVRNSDEALSLFGVNYSSLEASCRDGVLSEREACAKVAEEYAEQMEEYLTREGDAHGLVRGKYLGAKRVAELIRARGAK